ncbi:MAG: DUF1841 family protein [Gammaproteobacteria bacterium]|nr:DUF1841 family protein [Gammaproteobacteria bacterium]
MLFGNDREQMRRVFIQSWRKHTNQEPMEPLEQTIASVIRQHPEYTALLENEGQALAKDYLAELGETNPFLHMGMHIALHEQLTTQRPDGIMDIYQQLVTSCQDNHEAEHLMMNCLSEALFLAQQHNRMPDEQAYLACLKSLTRKH